MVFSAVVALLLAAIDLNIILPALFTAIPLTLGAVGGFMIALHNIRKERKTHELAVLSAVEALHADIRTNHGMTPGQYLELVGELTDWARTHQIQDNEIRVALGLRPGEVPEWGSRN